MRNSDTTDTCWLIGYEIGLINLPLFIGGYELVQN